MEKNATAVVRLTQLLSHEFLGSRLGIEDRSMLLVINSYDLKIIAAVLKQINLTLPSFSHQCHLIPTPNDKITDPIQSFAPRYVYRS